MRISSFCPRKYWGQSWSDEKPRKIRCSRQEQTDERSGDTRFGRVDSQISRSVLPCASHKHFGGAGNGNVSARIPGLCSVYDRCHGGHSHGVVAHGCREKGAWRGNEKVPRVRTVFAFGGGGSRGYSHCGAFGCDCPLARQYGHVRVLSRHCSRRVFRGRDCRPSRVVSGRNVYGAHGGVQHSGTGGETGCRDRACHCICSARSQSFGYGSIDGDYGVRSRCRALSCDNLCGEKQKSSF